MSFPDFYARVPKIVLRDPLAEFLGAAERGIVEYGYADAVRLAGHSCPTVAGSYILAHRMLKRLYVTDLPERGSLRVEFRDGEGFGVTGVTAALVGMVTGAAAQGGFKGLAGRFARHNLLAFAVPGLVECVRITRLNDGSSVEASFDLGILPADPQLPALLQGALADTALPSDLEAFAEAWQTRVRILLQEYFEHPALVRFRT